MRECGILLPIASLPSKYGIGTFSREAYDFIDELKEAGQNYWQILPLGPTGYGDSPYQSFSAFAGNPYFIDLEQLMRAGLLTQKECEEADQGQDERTINYEAIYNSRFVVLRKAYERWKKKVGEKKKDISKFLEKGLCEETREYCFYAAVKKSFGEKNWSEWDEDIKQRKELAVKKYQKELADDIQFYEFQQIMFKKQWSQLKQYAHMQGIRIIGDIPIYVAFDSADSWCHPELFQFDEKCRPISVAGCPPDGFSATGQLWGNPLYRWDYHEETGFAWWMRRMEFCFDLYDVVRVDHFRGFDEYYSIPAGEPTAMHGAWKKGPGISIFKKMKETFGNVDIIAEDLGFLTPSVLKLLEDTGFPGMKVLQFAFDSREESDYMPHNYTANCVVYTGTHDNQTTKSWWDEMTEADRNVALRYMNLPGKMEDLTAEEITWQMIVMAQRSVASLCVIPAQDYLSLTKEARMNTPSTLGCNWHWRMKEGDFSEELCEKIYRTTKLYGRL